ncbi:MAG: acyltransferase family protein [Actinomycetota bacterium]|nr:acyltransferase family protein [Actinomycetota bacterium]
MAEQSNDDSSGLVRDLIDERANAWSLDDVDPAFQNRLLTIWKPIMDHYFRMEIGGWERLPPAPSLLIGVHASGLLPIDAYLTGFQWYRHFGADRPLHGTAHDVLMSLPGWGAFMRKIGTVPASAESISTTLGAGHDVILWPGGDLDALRPWTQRDQVVLGGRSGFIKLAIRTGVPIVPVATTGGSDTLIMLTGGRGLAKRLRVDRVLRAKTMPIALGFPLGVAPGVVPQLPLPAKIRTEFCEPVELSDDPERAGDDDYVQSKYDEVEAALQAGMARLAKKRRFPIFG